MDYTNKFTSLNLNGRKLVTGDSLGNIVNWNLDAEPVSHEIQGRLGEEILEIFVSGLTTLCRTVSGKIYYWTMHSQRYGAEIGMRIAKCELLNTTSSINLDPEYEDDGQGGEGDVIPFKYELSLDLYHPTLRVYGQFILYLVNIEDGEVASKPLEPAEEYICLCLGKNGFQFQDGCYITPDGIVEVESENFIAKFINSYGQEEMERYEEENKSICEEYVYKVEHPQKSLYAFVELVVDFDKYDFETESTEEEDETNDFYYIRIAGISKLDIKYWRYNMELFTEGYSSINLEAIHDFKIKKTEAVKLSFCEDQLATINQAGNIKIFDIKNKCVLHEIKPLTKPQTDEFGEEVF